MASNLTRDKPEISSLGSKKSKSESSSVDTPLSAQSCPISEETLIAGKDSPVTLAMLFKEEEPFYRGLVDQIENHPAFIQWKQYLEYQGCALSGDNPPKFDVEACTSAVKNILDNGQLMADIRRFKTAVEQLIPFMPVETTTDTNASFSYYIPLVESKNGGPPTFKRNLNDTDTLQKDLVEECRRTFASISSLPKERRNEYTYELVTGVKINAKEESGRTALHSACAKGKYELVPGVDINSADKLGRTGLHSACANGKVKKAEFYIDNGANLDLPDMEGNTALHYAAGHGNELCVKLMIERGADATLKNSYGDTPYGIAELNDETGVMDLINKLVAA